EAPPRLAAVFRVQHDADGPAAGQLLAADDPADVGVEEVQALERRALAARQALPVLAAVDGVPDDALVADGPALALVDELDGSEGAVFMMAQLGGGRIDGGEAEQGQAKEGAHAESSRRTGGTPVAEESPRRAGTGGRGIAARTRRVNTEWQ